MVRTQPVPQTIEDTVVNINGTFVPGDEAHVSVLDRNFLYGDGVFDGMPIYDGTVVLFDRHIDRFYRSIRAAKIPLSLSKESFADRAIETIERSGVRNGAVRFIVSRGIGPVGISNTDRLEDPTVVIIPQRIPEDELPKGRITLETASIVSTRTVPPDCIDPKIKSCNYLPNALAEREASQAGADFAIMLAHDGTVAEAHDANLFVRDESGVFRTPPLVNALCGITRDVFIEIAEREGYSVKIGDITPYDLHTAADAFMTSSGRWISYIETLDGQPIGGGQPSDAVESIAASLYEYITTEEIVELSIA